MGREEVEEGSEREGGCTRFMDVGVVMGSYLLLSVSRWHWR